MSSDEIWPYHKYTVSEFKMCVQTSHCLQSSALSRKQMEDNKKLVKNATKQAVERFMNTWILKLKVCTKSTREFKVLIVSQPLNSSLLSEKEKEKNKKMIVRQHRSVFNMLTNQMNRWAICHQMVIRLQFKLNHTI